MDFSDLIAYPEIRIDEALQSIYRVIRPEGIGFISIKRGEGEKIEVDEPQMEGGRKRLFSYYSQDEFKEVLERNGYEVTGESIRPMAGRTIWLVYFVKVIKPRQS